MIIKWNVYITHYNVCIAQEKYVVLRQMSHPDKVVLRAHFRVGFLSLKSFQENVELLSLNLTN